MRILGIDPGSRITGYGVVEHHSGRLRHIAHGTIVTGEGDLAQRLRRIHDGLAAVIADTAPAAVAVEDIYVASNARSALKLGQARGVALLAGVLAGLPVFEYTAMQVKSAVVGYGRADKAQVQQMVKTLLALPAAAVTDASDALAVAICHGHSHGLQDRLAALCARGKR